MSSVPPQDFEAAKLKHKAKIEEINRQLNNPPTVWVPAFVDRRNPDAPVKYPGHYETLVGTSQGREAAIRLRLHHEAALAEIEKIERSAKDLTRAVEPISAAQVGRLDLGKKIDVLYKELKRLKSSARGRRKRETDLKAAFPQLELWKEIDASESLRKRYREQFFGRTLDSYGARELMDFIGNIVALEGSSAYKTWKDYRKKTGLSRKRIAKAARHPQERTQLS